VVDNACETPIFECFLDEQLFRVWLELWYADIINHLVTGEAISNGLRIFKNISLQCFSFLDGMIPISSGIAKSKSLGVYSITKFLVSYPFVMTTHVVNTLVGGKQP